MRANRTGDFPRARGEFRGPLAYPPPGRYGEEGGIFFIAIPYNILPGTGTATDTSTDTATAPGPVWNTGGVDVPPVVGIRIYNVPMRQPQKVRFGTGWVDEPLAVSIGIYNAPTREQQKDRNGAAGSRNGASGIRNVRAAARKRSVLEPGGSMRPQR